MFDILTYGALKRYTSAELAKLVYVKPELMTYDDIQRVVRLGDTDKIFVVGDQLQTTHSAYTSIVWDVVGITDADHTGFDPADSAYFTKYPDAKPMLLLMHHVIYGRQFDAPEMLWANTSAAPLPAGTYNFTLFKGSNNGETGEDGTYQFTTAQDIPVGGGFRHGQVGISRSPASLYVPANIIGNHITTYNASRTAIESDLTVSAGSGGTELGTASKDAADIISLVGTLNGVQRNASGSNNWGQSAVRQWLNSAAEANAWWTPQTIFDRPPTYANVAGFLNGLDADFVAILGETDHVTVNNTVTDGGGATPSYVTRDKIYLPSRTEIYGTHENELAPEGAQYPLYVGSDDADKIKYDIASQAAARTWWMRSPYASYAYIARYVTTSGALSNNSAYTDYGAAAACVIL